jgi:hypothetical protein
MRGLTILHKSLIKSLQYNSNGNDIKRKANVLYAYIHVLYRCTFIKGSLTQDFWLQVFSVCFLHNTLKTVRQKIFTPGISELTVQRGRVRSEIINKDRYTTTADFFVIPLLRQFWEEKNYCERRNELSQRRPVALPYRHKNLCLFKLGYEVHALLSSICTSSLARRLLLCTQCHDVGEIRTPHR